MSLNRFVEMQHGSGGRATLLLVRELFQRILHNPWLLQGNDATVLPQAAGRIVVATDAHVVSPLFFPGGNIGVLAVNGTVNDLAVMGAQPQYLTASFIIEAGFPMDDLEEIVQSMAEAAQIAQVSIVAGDTKVVEHGKADGIYISTTGIGMAMDANLRGGQHIREGDVIILSGTLGEHGIAVLSKRENMQFASVVKSDTAALWELVSVILYHVPEVCCMRDPTRGGLATTLNELCEQAGVGMRINEDAIPISTTVQSACELFGLDPLYIANEGRLVAFCPPQYAERLLAVMREHADGQHAAIIGEVVADKHHCVQMKTSLGGYRIVDWMMGDPLPRIC